MLSDITRDEKDIGGRDDVLRTSIAMDNRSVKPLPARESPASGGVSVVEPGDGLGAQLWIEPGERLAGAAAGSTGRDATPTLAGMVLSSRRQSGEEAAYAGGGTLFCAIVAARVLAWWPEERQEVALALDATTLGDSKRITYPVKRV